MCATPSRDARTAAVCSRFQFVGLVSARIRHYTGQMTKTFSGLKNTSEEYRRTHAQYDAALVRANQLLKGRGMNSKDFHEANDVAGKLFDRLGELEA